jgi:hypothetical protein
MLGDYLTLENARFEIRFVEGERPFAEETLGTLSEALPSLTRTFLLAEPLPKVRAVLVTHRAEFDRLVRDLLRVQIEVPSHPARIAQPQGTDMVVLSPSAYANHSIFTYVPDQFGRLLIHELVHMVEEHLSPNVEAIPRWWSEGLAVVLSEQWRHEDGFRRPALDGIARNDVPGLRQIEAETKLAYDWGWTIVRFIEVARGRAAIVRVVKECADGNVFSAMGETAGSLETRWRSWLLAEGRFRLD